MRHGDVSICSMVFCMFSILPPPFSPPCPPLVPKGHPSTPPASPALQRASLASLASPCPWPRRPGRRWAIWAAAAKARDLGSNGSKDGMISWENHPTVDGTPMEYLGNIYTPMEYLWNIYGMSRESLWNIYLVGGIATHLKNMKVSWDDELPNIWKNKKCSKPPLLRSTFAVFAPARG